MKHCTVCGKEVESGVKYGSRVLCKSCSVVPFRGVRSIFTQFLLQKIKKENGKG